MDTIIKSFSVSFLLRSFFSGVFFVLSYYVTSGGGKYSLEFDSTTILSVGLPFALVAGVTVYGIHRSIIYPLLEWIFNSTWAHLTYFRARIFLDSEAEKAIPQCLKYFKNAYLAPLEMLKENLTFDQKAEFHSEFGRAYAMTLKPDGQFRNKTKATDIYFRLLTQAITWPIYGL